MRAEALDEPRQVLWAAAGGIFIGDRGRALRSLDRAVALARERAAVALPARTSSACAPTWRCGTGGCPRRPPTRTRRRGWPQDIGAENARALPITSLAWLTGLRGDEAECRRLADEVLEMAIDRGLALPAASATWALAQLDVALGRWDEALVRLLALEEIRPGFGHPDGADHDLVGPGRGGRPLRARPTSPSSRSSASPAGRPPPRPAGRRSCSRTAGR